MAKKNYDEENIMLEKSELELLKEKLELKKAQKLAKKQGLPIPQTIEEARGEVPPSPEESSESFNENEYFDDSEYYEDPEETDESEDLLPDTEENYDEEDIDIGGFGRYPRIYMDPSEIMIGESGREEIYFNIERTLINRHLGWLWKLIPQKIRDLIEDKVYNADFLHDYANIQHNHAEKLNAMTPGQQRMHDLKVLGVKLLILFTILGSIYAYNIFVTVPNNTYARGLSQVETKHYSEAIESFSTLNGKWYSSQYSTYCQAFLLLNEGEYDKAKETFKSLADYQNVCLKMNDLNELQKECEYQKALSYYAKHDWETTADLLEPIIKYSNAVEYYQKCVYEVANNYSSQGDIYNAIKQYSRILSFSNAQELRDQLLDGIYNQAIVLYNEKKYMEASDLFNTITDYDYLDTNDKCIQCFYKYAHDLYSEKRYDEAQEIFSQIPNYKDSLTMVKECVYQKLDAVNFDSKNIINILYLKGYRKINSIINTAPYNIYAEWVIKSQDGIQSGDAYNKTFIFTPENYFKTTETKLPCVAVTDDTLQYPYFWNEDHFETKDLNNFIYIDDFKIFNEVDNTIYQITLRCQEKNIQTGELNETVYICRKINDLTKYYENTLIVNQNGSTDLDLIDLYLKEKGDTLKTDTSSDSDHILISTEPLGPVEENPTIEDEQQSVSLPEETTETTISETEKHVFQAEVKKVSSEMLLVTSDDYSQDDMLEPNTNYYVLYDKSYDFAEGDIVSVVFYDYDFDDTSMPAEIRSDNVTWVSSTPISSTSPNEEAEENIPAPLEESKCSVVLKSAPAMVTENTNIPIVIRVNSEINTKFSVYCSIDGDDPIFLIELDSDGQEKDLSFDLPGFDTGTHTLVFYGLDFNNVPSNVNGDINILTNPQGNSTTIKVE